jgi:hypothetical protein
MLYWSELHSEDHHQGLLYSPKSRHVVSVVISLPEKIPTAGSVDCFFVQFVPPKLCFLKNFLKTDSLNVYAWDVEMLVFAWHSERKRNFEKKLLK